jgi:hypothetical protein
MQILFEAIRANSRHGSLLTYDHGPQAYCGTIFHSHLAAPYSCQQHLSNDSYKDAFLTY